MIQADKIFSTNLNSPVRNIQAKVEIYYGSTLSLTVYSTDKIKSIEIQRVGNENKFFGFGVCQRLNLKLVDNARYVKVGTNAWLKVYFGMNSKYVCPYPDFRISQVRRDENTNELSITAYDKIYNPNGYTYEDLGIKPPYTIGTLVYNIRTKLGISAAAAGYEEFKLNYPEGGNYEGKETLREVLDDVAEATQTIYYINNEDRLVFRRLSPTQGTSTTISKEQYFTLESGANRRLKTICSMTELGDNVSASTSQSGTTQNVRENPLWVLRDDLGQLLQKAIANVGGLTINQFTCSWRGNFLLEPGDKIALTTKDGETVSSFVLNDVVSYDGSLNEETQWHYEDDNENAPSNPATLGDALNQTYARVDKVGQKIELVAKQSNDNKDAIAQIKIDTGKIKTSVSEVSKTVSSNKTATDTAIKDVNNKVDNNKNNSDSQIKTITEKISTIEQDANQINASVSRVEKQVNENQQANTSEIQSIKNQVDATMTAEDVKIEIQKEMDNGVDKVQTSTGFTFNDKGMRVSKSESDMETLITEDGMRISRKGQEVLKANNQGVNAENLHATTYLIIGKYSRFEDYGNRTGCFWIG